MSEDESRKLNACQRGRWKRDVGVAGLIGGVLGRVYWLLPVGVLGRRLSPEDLKELKGGVDPNEGGVDGREGGRMPKGESGREMAPRKFDTCWRPEMSKRAEDDIGA
jgi:hypothetical protein